jgi:hypothetical protein
MVGLLSYSTALNCAKVAPMPATKKTRSNAPGLVTLEDKLKELSPERRKRIEARTTELIAEELERRKRRAKRRAK